MNPCLSVCLFVWWLKPMKTYYFALFKNPFSFISRSPSSCWDTLLAHEAKWHFQPKLVIWSKYYFHSLKTLIGDLKYYFPILYLCLFLRPVMIFPQGKLLSCLFYIYVCFYFMSKFMKAQKDIYFPYIRFSTLLYINIIWVKPWKPFLSVIVFWDVSKGNDLNKFP